VRFGQVLALFFLSGACGLTYQVLWLRLLSLVFGVTVYAASTVLAAFMAGLALGSAAAGPLVSRIRRPLRVFGIAEILIGVSALSTPWALGAASAIYAPLRAAGPDSLAMLTTARVLVSFVVLLVPTMLMGLTLPVLSASSVVRGSRFGSRLGALYAVNTAGAVTGAVLTGFYLIGAIGMRRSFLLGATVNVLVGVLALWLDRGDAPARADGTPVIEHAGRSATPWPAIATFVTVSGFVALALEIVWFRMLLQYLAATTYAFTTMLATVLAGIATGGAVAARLLRHDGDWATRLVVIQVTSAVLCLASAVFLGWSYGAGWRTSGDIQASVTAILPVAVMMGVSFPVALHLAASPAAHETAGAVARRVGRLYALNVTGAIAGALVGGFLLLPQLGTRRSLIAVAALLGVSALPLVLRHPRRGRMVAVLGVAAAAFASIAARVPDPFTAAYQRRYGRDMREFWRDEGAQTAVSVHVSQFRRALYLDGLHQANDGPEMVLLHRVIGHLPMVLHPAPENALVIGLGGGATSGAVSQYPGTRVQVVELSDGVRRAASFFAHVNYDVLEQPNVHLRVDDGRNFLLLSGERFDVITADIIQPVHAGAGNLYSREYFTLVRRALADGGLVLQWIGHRPPTQYRLIMRTFLDVFPHATLWLDGNLMVGSLTPLTLDPSALARRRTVPQTAAALDEIGLGDVETLRSWYTGGPDEMRRYVGPGLLLTDDRPLMEYHRSLPPDTEELRIDDLRGDVSTIIRQ
jgi:spermidine synthase